MVRSGGAGLSEFLCSRGSLAQIVTTASAQYNDESALTDHSGTQTTRITKKGQPKMMPPDELKLRYESFDTEELRELANKDLTDTARSILHDVLKSRGFSPETLNTVSTPTDGMSANLSDGNALLAPLSSRFFAALLDLVAGMLGAWLLALPFWFHSLELASNVAARLFFFYFLIRDSIPGQSLGKRSMGIRCEQVATGRKCSWSMSALRNLSHICLVIDLLPALGRHRNRIGDILAGTRVVRQQNRSLDSTAHRPAAISLDKRFYDPEAQACANEVRQKIKAKQIRPWVRFGARFFDVFLVLSILGMLTTWLVQQSHAPSVFGFLFFTCALLVPLEAFLLTVFQTTPGKWLMNVRVISESGKRIQFREALLRSLSVWCRGLGLALPFLSIVMPLHGHARLVRHGKTNWDETGGFRRTSR